MHGCAYGIAVFDRVDGEAFNPNVALEVGYMLAMGKKVCLLKDKSIPKLHADLVGLVYREFDTYDPDTSIPDQIVGWLRDRDIIRTAT
jgi:nucleoside 2-deoxyribosyltransferase